MPLSIFLSIFSKEVWTCFYGESFYGPLIFKYIILLAILDSAYIMICSALQGLSKTNLIYISVATGLITKTILDIPLIFLFNKLGIYPFYGAILATTIGYILSLIIPLYTLKTKYKFNYQKTIKSIPKLVLTVVILIVISVLLRNIVFSRVSGRIAILLALGVIGLVDLIIYYLLNKELLNDLLGDKILKKFKKNK